MFSKYLEILLLILPAAFANMIPPFAAKMLPDFNVPIDFGLKLGEYRIFGDHKTIRGLLFGVLVAQLGFMVIRFIALSYLTTTGTIFATFTELPLFFGALVGAIALFGDAIKSFFKRRVGIKPGNPWFPFDQLDWMLASLVYIVFFIQITWQTLLFALFLGLVGHLISKVIGYFIGINKDLI